MARSDDVSPKVIRKIVLLLVTLVVMTLLCVGGCTSMHDVGSDEIVVVQMPNGKMEVWNTPGWKFALFARTTVYKKSDQYHFMYDKDDKGTVTSKKDCLATRFNDQGSAHICGTLSFDLPSDADTMLKLHNKFRSMDGIVVRLVKPAVIKSVYNSGPMMSSKESAGKKRSDLINFIQDQATRGIYKTSSRQEEVPDLLAPPIDVVEMVDVPKVDDNGEPIVDDNDNPVMIRKPRKTLRPATKKVTIVEPKLGKDGRIEVQELSTVTEYGIKMYNITLERILYEPKVKEQINAQRDMTMKIQTKIAEAKNAQQDTITAEQMGKAAAAKAKWEEERKKATAVTAAESQKAVAVLDLEKAKLEAEARLTRARAEAESKKLVMLADGALDKKLQAWVDVQKAYAAEMGKQRWVPEVQMGGSSSGAESAASLMQLWQVKAARDLGLDLSVQK
jgi:hypothetical protein